MICLPRQHIKPASVHTNCYMHSERMKLREHLVDLVAEEKIINMEYKTHNFSDAINN
jgi:hypothetical protein